MIHCSALSPAVCAFPGDDNECNSHGRVVRFHSECLLIPSQQATKQRPRIVTKSYSLPLWKKASKPLSSPALSEVEVAAANSQPETPIEDTHVVFKVALPRIKTHKRPHRVPSRENLAKPLSPCLVYRDPQSPRLPSARRPSLPIHFPTNGCTIPLRSCCTACHTIIEKSSKEGEQWQAKFSDGAAQRRTRSASADDALNRPSVYGASSSDARRGSPCHSTGGLAAAVVVDEVEQKRRSSSDSSVHPCTMAGPTPTIIRRRYDDEEDEDQLFPLPSTRLRTPSPRTTPNPSPTASTYSLGGTCSTSSLPLASTDVPSDVLDKVSPLRRQRSMPLQQLETGDCPSLLCVPLLSNSPSPSSPSFSLPSPPSPCAPAPSAIATKDCSAPPSFIDDIPSSPSPFEPSTPPS